MVPKHLRACRSAGNNMHNPGGTDFYLSSRTDTVTILATQSEGAAKFYAQLGGGCTVVPVNIIGSRVSIDGAASPFIEHHLFGALTLQGNDFSRGIYSGSLTMTFGVNCPDGGTTVISKTNSYWRDDIWTASSFIAQGESGMMETLSVLRMKHREQPDPDPID
jgi:hypothetical protein